MQITNERLNEMISIQKEVAEDATKESGTVHTLENQILSALKELKEYRDIGPTPEQLKEVDRMYMEKCMEVDGLNEAIRNICRNLSTKEFTEGDTYECLLSLSLPFQPGGKGIVEPHTMWKLKKIAEDGWFVLQSLENSKREIQTKYLSFVVSFKRVKEKTYKCNMPQMVAGMNQIKSVIERQPKVGEWIPCSERLPEDMQKCLTTAKIYFIPDHVDEIDNYVGIEINTYSKKYGWIHNQNVTAWMPLPGAYSEDNDV